MEKSLNGAWRTQLNSWYRSHLLARGERSIASTGAAAVAVLLGAMGANGWWMLSTARESDAATRLTQICAIGTVLSHSAEVMLGSGDLSAVEVIKRLIGDDRHQLRAPAAKAWIFFHREQAMRARD